MDLITIVPLKVLPRCWAHLLFTPFVHTSGCGLRQLNRKSELHGKGRSLPAATAATCATKSLFAPRFSSRSPRTPTPSAAAAAAAAVAAATVPATFFRVVRVRRRQYLVCRLQARDSKAGRPEGVGVGLGGVGEERAGEARDGPGRVEDRDPGDSLVRREAARARMYRNHLDIS